jgi:RimJ/RimL family protein N-acetyltransferase
VILINDKDWISQWVMARTGDDFPMGCQAALGAVDENDSIVAGVIYDHYTGPCVTATIAVEHKHLPRQLIRAMFAYPFIQMMVEKVIVYINSANEASFNLAQRLGFVTEATVKNVYEDGDMLVLSLYKRDCIWLKELHHG